MDTQTFTQSPTLLFRHLFRTYLNLSLGWLLLNFVIWLRLLEEQPGRWYTLSPWLFLYVPLVPLVLLLPSLLDWWRGRQLQTVTFTPTEIQLSPTLTIPYDQLQSAQLLDNKTLVLVGSKTALLVGYEQLPEIIKLLSTVTTIKDSSTKQGKIFPYVVLFLMAYLFLPLYAYQPLMGLGQFAFSWGQYHSPVLPAGRRKALSAFFALLGVAILLVSAAQYHQLPVQCDAFHRWLNQHPCLLHRTETDLTANFVQNGQAIMYVNKTHLQIEPINGWFTGWRSTFIPTSEHFYQFQTSANGQVGFAVPLGNSSFFEVYDLTTYQKTTSYLNNGFNTILGVSTSGDTALVAVYGEPKQGVQWLETATGRVLHTFPGPAALAPNEQTIAFYDPATFTIHLWDVAQQQTTKSWEWAGATEEKSCLAYSPNGRWLAGLKDEQIIVWSTETGQSHSWTAGELTSWCKLTFSPDSQWLIPNNYLSWNEQHPAVWRVSDGQFITLLPFTHSYWHMEFSPDGTKLLAAGQHDIWLLDFEKILQTSGQ